MFRSGSMFSLFGRGSNLVVVRRVPMEDESKAVAAMRATPASSTLALYVDRWAARIIRELSPLEPVTHEEREWLVARAVAAAHRELVFGLVERAEERVMHLRAQDAA